MKIKYLNLAWILSISVSLVSCAVAPLTTAPFNQDVSVEEKSEQGNYLLKNDDSKIYGKKIKGLYGLVVKDYISIDGQKFKPSEIKGYREGKFYYARLKSAYIKRVVHGAINVYIHQENHMQTSGATNMSRNVIRIYQYYQNGDNGELILFGDKDIKEIVKGCPKAESLADKSAGELRKAIRKNPNYINEIFEVYNKDCSLLKTKS